VGGEIAAGSKRRTRGGPRFCFGEGDAITVVGVKEGENGILKGTKTPKRMGLLPKKSGAYGGGGANYCLLNRQKLLTHQVPPDPRAAEGLHEGVGGGESLMSLLEPSL